MASLSVRAAAELARTSDRTVRRWIAENKLAATKTVDGWTVDESDLAALLDGRPGRPTPMDGHSESVRPTEARYLAELVRELVERAEANAAAAAMWQARAEQLQAQLALAAPKESVPSGSPQTGPTNAFPVEPTQIPSTPPRRAPWWAVWRRATA